jgi:hypothetical protein
VRGVGDVTTDQTIITRFADGTVRSRVETAVLNEET